MQVNKFRSPSKLSSNYGTTSYYSTAFPKLFLLDITVKFMAPFNSIASKLMEYYMYFLIKQNFSLFFLEGKKKVLILTKCKTPDVFYIWQ